MSIVVDIGTSFCKAGFGGHEAPQSIFPSVVGVGNKKCEKKVENTAAVGGESKEGETLATSTSATAVSELDREGGNSMEVEQETIGNDPTSTMMSMMMSPPSSPLAPTRQYFVGDALTTRRDGMSLCSPFEDGASVTRWDSMEEIWQHVFRSLSVNPKTMGIMLAEPSFNARSAREKQAEIIFENFRSPSLFIAKTAALCCYSNARGTGVVYDSGGGSTSACVVAEGYVIQKSVVRNEMSGRALDEVVLRAIENVAGVGKNSLRPRYAYKRTVRPDGSTLVEAADYPETHGSYHDYMRLEIGRDIRESLCQCSEEKFDAARGGNIPTKRYKLPDETEISVGAERFLVPELMFDADAMETRFNFIPAHTMVHTSVEKCGDLRLRKELYNNIVIAGGNTSYAGFQDRLRYEIGSRLSTALRARVVGGLKPGDRKTCAWHGGSILASLDSFTEMWISKSEFNEFGSSIVDRKCP